MSALRRRQPAVAAFVLLVVGILSVVLTRGLEFLAAVSIIVIAVQGVVAANFRLLSTGSASRPEVRSNEPFRFRTIEETIISAAFALAGVATLTGILHASRIAGWLAMGAAVAGAANIVATRRSHIGRLRETH